MYRIEIESAAVFKKMSKVKNAISLNAFLLRRRKVNYNSSSRLHTQLFSSLISLVSLTPKSKLQQKELNLAHGRNKNQKNTTKKCGNVCFCLSFPHFFLNFFGLFSFSPFSK
jgi:hypothetical protein